MQPTHADASVATATEPSASALRWVQGIEPSHLLFLLALFTAVLLSSNPITDIDAYWHVMLGREIIAQQSVHGVGNDWSLYRGGQDWVTSQWLSEVLMARLVHAFGWTGLVVARQVLSLVLIGQIAALSMLGRSPRIGVFVFGSTAIPLSALFQERPQLVSLLFLPGLAVCGTRMLRGSSGPPVWLAALVVAVWANFHGLWVIAPVTWALVLAGVALDERGLHGRRVRSAAILTVATLVAGCATPLGPRGLILPWVLRSATGRIAEWSPTVLWDPYSLGLLLLGAGAIWGWMHSATPVPRSEVLWVTAWIVFALPVTRNIAVSVLMVAPSVANRLGSRASPMQRRGRLERRLLAAAAVVFVTFGATSAVRLWAGTRPLAAASPLKIAERLAATPGEKKIFNAYNASGVLLAFGGPGVKLAIDGRADRYGNDYVTRYLDAELLQPGWRRVFDPVHADYAVLHRDSALAYELRAHEHWLRVMTDDRYVLLQRP